MRFVVPIVAGLALLTAPMLAAATEAARPLDLGVPKTARAAVIKSVALDAAPAPEAVPAKPKKPATKAGLPKQPSDPVVVGSIDPTGPFEAEPGVVLWYRERGAVFPDSDRPVFCHAYGCELQTPIPLGAADFQAFAKLFAAHQGSAEEERKAISASVQYWERKAAPLLGGPPRTRGSDFARSHQPGQTDCLDTATNSTTIMLYLERHKLLKYHHVLRPESRGMMLYSHATAVMAETGGKDWVVDAWMYDSGDPPDMMTLDEWSSHW